jgi:metal-responsive CopG/Arc/MetJ family transcriptional regulator
MPGEIQKQTFVSKAMLTEIEDHQQGRFRYRAEAIRDLISKGLKSNKPIDGYETTGEIRLPLAVSRKHNSAVERVMHSLPKEMRNYEVAYRLVIGRGLQSLSNSKP